MQSEQQHLKTLRHLPAVISEVLKLDAPISEWAQGLATKRPALFLGPGAHWPIALEGALKLKEISYIHAEGYAGGELKHGPLALVDGDMPIVAVALNDALLEKLKSNPQEVKVRGGRLFVFADADSEVGDADGIQLLRLPVHIGPLSPLVQSCHCSYWRTTPR